MTSTGHLRVETADGIRTITIDRPAVRNALSAAMRQELVDLMAEADGDDGVAVVILTGAGDVFSAGVDLKELTGPNPPPLPAKNPAEAIREVRKPVLCAVNGTCVTGALEIALACTVIVASDRARFADTHAKVGLVPAWGMSAMLPRAVGLRKARELSITGAFVDAAEALRIGLVGRVVPHERLLAETIALARQIAGCDARAVRTILDVYARADGLAFADALAVEADTARGFRMDPVKTREGLDRLTGRKGPT